MWTKISKLFSKTNTNLNNDQLVVENTTMDREDRRRMNSQDYESQDSYDTRQAKQRASVKWLLSKSYNNRVPENIREPFYRDHEDQEHLKPQIIHKLANAELYCLGLANIYSDPNYHNLNHSGIIQTLIRKGVFVSEPPDAQLTETVLIQTTPLKMSAHMAVIEAMMVLYAKEVVTPDRVVAAIQRFTQSPRPEPLPLDYEDAILLWVNKASSALRQKIEQDLGSADSQAGQGDRQRLPVIPEVRELKDLCDGVGLAALVSFYCPEELPWTELVTGYLPTISDSVHNVLLVHTFCNQSLPSSLFHMMPEDITYMRVSMKQNLVVFLADLFNVLEIHPVKCVRFPGSERSLREVYPRNSQGVVHKRSLPQSIAAIPDLRSGFESDFGIHSSSFTVSVSKSCPVQTSLPVRKSTPPAPSYSDRPSEEEQFVVHRGRGVPTLSSVVQSEEPLVPARLRQAKEKHYADSKAEEYGEPAAAGRPSHWEDARRSSYAGRRSRRNSITEDSQLTIENFGGSQEHLNFIGRNPDKEVGGHVGRKTPVPDLPLRTSAQDSRSSGVELIFQDTNNFSSEKRDEEKTVSSKVLHSKPDYSLDDLGSKVATSFAELSRLKDSGTYTKKNIHTVYMQHDQDPDDDRDPPPKKILNKNPIASSNGGSEKKTTSFAALPNNTTTWQQQSSTNQQQSSDVAPREENSQVMASQLLNIRMKLEEKRRHIEGEKRRMEVVMNKQRQKVGKAAFLQAVTKGKSSFVKSPESEMEKDTNCDLVQREAKPQRPFSLQEISDDATTVEHKWLDSGVPYVEERKTPDIENMDLEQYQQSISQMNTSLHDIQTDIQRLASQQNQIQDLTQMQGFVTQQQQQFQGLANQHQHQLQSLATQQQQIQNLAFQQQQLQTLVRTQSVESPPQFYLHDQQTHRRTWAPPSMQTLPHDLAYPHPDPRMTWADHQPGSFNPQPAAFILHEAKPQVYASHVNNAGAGDGRYQNGDNHAPPQHHSMGTFNQPGGFQLHPDQSSSPGGYSSKSHSELGSSPRTHSELGSCPSDYGSPHHRSPPVPPPRRSGTPEKSRAAAVIHAPLPTPPVDDMEPQSISFIGMPSSTSDDPNSSLAQSIKGLQITSGSRTYRIPSPTRPAIARNSFQQQEPLDSSSPLPRPVDGDDDDETTEKGFYISFDNDPQPLRPKPPLRTKRMSPKKERAPSQYESNISDRLESKPTPPFRSSTFSDRQESSGYNDRGVNNRQESRAYNDRIQPKGESDWPEPVVQRAPEPRRVPAQPSGVGLVIGNELGNLEPSTIDEMEKKKERIMLLSLQRRQQQEELKQQKEMEAERRREEEKYKQEDRERKKEEERERRQIILEQYKLKKAMEEAEREGKTLPVKSDFLTMKPAPKLRNKTGAGTRPRPKTIHVDSGALDDHDGILSPSRSKKGSTSNLADPVFNSNSRRDYYRGSQDNLADRMEQRRGVGTSLFSRDSPDDGRGTSPSRGTNQLGRRGSYKTSRDTSEPRRISGRPKYPSYQGTSNFRGRKSNSLMNLSGSSTDQDSMAYRYGDTDSGLGRATPPRRAPSPGMSSMRHLPSPSGPGSLPPGLITKRRTFDDGSSDISSNLSSMMEYTGPRLYKQPSSKSNRPIMLNAVEYCVFPGVVNREAKTRVLEEISRSESKHFLILFRDAGCQFRALYSYCPDREEVAKLYGTGPKQVNDKMFDRFFKYNSGGKCFSQIHTKHLTVTIDAFTIQNSLWQGKKVSLPNKKDMHLVI